MFWVTRCPSSGETVTWYLLFCVDDCLVCRITSTKCRINTVVSPDDGHSHPKHVEIDKYTKNKYTENKLCTSWLYLQDYTGMHGQQNIESVCNKAVR
jgi:hypothetical protein